VPSTVIRAFHYNAEHQALEVTFVSGLRYRYLAVPIEIYERLRSSSAKGIYFNRHIRDNFEFKKL
jgi:hypothetical protein